MSTLAVLTLTSELISFQELAHQQFLALEKCFTLTHLTPLTTSLTMSVRKLTCFAEFFDLL